MRSPVFIIILINLLVYGIAFGVSYLRHQSVKVYVIFLSIQVIILLLDYFDVGRSGGGSGNDAAGAGMARGYRYMALIGILLTITAVVLMVFLARQVSGKLWIQLLIVGGVLLVIYFFRNTDYKATFLSITSTNEAKLNLLDSVMYKNNKPFTGTSMYRGVVETYPSMVTARASNGEEYTTCQGIRTTHYKNGLKEGEERLYYTDDNGSELNSTTNYHQGLKDGQEIIFDSNGNRQTEINYANGQRHGMYREHYRIDKCLPYQKPLSKHVGALRREIEYKNGEQTGIYRTYSPSGRLTDDYVTENGKIVNGRIKTHVRGDENNKECDEWKFYENGQLVREEVYLFGYFDYNGGPDPDNQPLQRKTFYQNGEITEELIYTFTWGDKEVKLTQHRKMINGVMTEIFNRQTGFDRRNESVQNDETKSN